MITIIEVVCCECHHHEVWEFTLDHFNKDITRHGAWCTRCRKVVSVDHIEGD